MPMENDPNGRGGPSTGRGPPPDIEELLRRGRSRLQSFLPGGGSRALIVAALLVGIVLLLWTSLFTVPSDSVAVMQRFGRYVEVVPAGLHVRLPLGIDTATIVPVKRQLKQEFGFTTPGASDPYQGGRDGRRETKRETEMVTGDLNAALVEWVVQYRISDPVKFLFEVREPSETLRYVSESVMREVVGDRTVDEVITIGRQEIESEALFKMQALSSKYAMGVSIDQVQLKNINPPEPVQESFNEVNQAQQEKEKLINEARRDYNKVIPLAEGEKDQRIREADGYRFKADKRSGGRHDPVHCPARRVQEGAGGHTAARLPGDSSERAAGNTLQDHPRRRGAWAVALPRPQCALGGSAVNRVLRVVWPALLAIGVFLGADALYTVNEVEQMIITQFGKPVGDPVTSAGLKIKLPLIQHVNPIDKRVLEWDGSPSDMPTKDKLYISVDLFARWRITDPLQYFLRLRDERSAQSRLDDILGSETRNAVAKHELIEIIRTTRDRVPLRDTLLTDAERELNMGALVPIQKGRQRVEQEIFTAAAEKVRVFGIELLDIRFKRINYNESVRPKIYDRMISERRQIAERFLSEGNGEAARIRGNRVRDLNKIQSEAYRQVEEIRGVADATAARIYAAAYGGSPEAIAFFEFTRTMRAYQTIIADNTTLVLSTDSDLFKYLKGMNPDDQPLTTPSVEAQRQ
jgi:membrane protease subunit HflC